MHYERFDVQCFSEYVRIANTFASNFCINFKFVCCFLYDFITILSAYNDKIRRHPEIIFKNLMLRWKWNDWLVQINNKVISIFVPILDGFNKKIYISYSFRLIIVNTKELTQLQSGYSIYIYIYDKTEYSFKQSAHTVSPLFWSIIILRVWFESIRICA